MPSLVLSRSHAFHIGIFSTQIVSLRSLSHTRKLFRLYLDPMTVREARINSFFTLNNTYTEVQPRNELKQI